MIEVGDTVINPRGDKATITEVISGKHGILLHGKFHTTDYKIFQTFCVPELPPTSEKNGEPVYWVNDVGIGYITLPNGIKIGTMAWRQYHGGFHIVTVAECDAMWKAAVEAAPIPMQSISLEELMDRRSKS